MAGVEVGGGGGGGGVFSGFRGVEAAWLLARRGREQRTTRFFDFFFFMARDVEVLFVKKTSFFIRNQEEFSVFRGLKDPTAL